MHGIPYRFDCWGDPDAHLLLLENSMVKLSQLWLTVPYIRATFWYVVVIEWTVYMPSLRTIRVRILLTWTSSWTGTSSDNSLIQCKFIRNGIQNASVIYSPVSCFKRFTVLVPDLGTGHHDSEGQPRVQNRCLHKSNAIVFFASVLFSMAVLAQPCR